MGLEEKAKAAAKNVEGKIEEGAGFVAGVPEAEDKGRAKQAEAKVRQAKVEAEEAEDKADRT